MKVGDMVRQGDRLVKFKGADKPHRSRAIGIIVAIHEETFPDKWDLSNINRVKWMAMLGRRIDVMWENGKLSESFAENSLEIINLNKKL